MRGASTAIALAVTMVACTTTTSRSLASAADDASVEARILELERESWMAWKAQDAAFFESFLADDHLELSGRGPGSKRDVVGFIRGGACKVESYAINDFRFKRLSETSGMLVYRVRQSTHCGGAAVPSPAWATSVFVLREGRWVNVLYQQLPETR